MKHRRKRNRTEKKITIDPKYIFGGMVVLCIVLIFCSYKFKAQFAPVKNAFGNFVTPMQQGINSCGEFLSNGFKRFSDIDDLIVENEALKQELDDLKNENRMLAQTQYEMNWYMELYDVDSKYAAYDKVAAKVISREPNSYCNVFIIDKGTDDGLAKNMNVISGNGLVGIVTDVGKNWARVRSIIDDASSISGMFVKTSDTCIVSGNLELIDDGYIDVDMISLNAEIYDNYEVVTSYISDKYLPGLLIGYVSNIHSDPSTMSQRAYLTPVVDFEHIEAVLVITELRETYDDLNEVLVSDN